MKNNREIEVARALLKIKAVGFAPDKPITFKSGIISPVYVDNRKFPYYPDDWQIVISGFKDIIEKENIDFDVLAGVEAAGIPHSAALGFFMKKPSIFVRKAVKDHGTKKRIEGGEVKGKKVVLIEDLVSTGMSSLSVVKALREEGAIVNDCIVIVTYEFPESVKAFKDEGIKLHALTSFPVILEEAIDAGLLFEENASKIQGWFADPHGWAGKYNLN